MHINMKYYVVTISAIFIALGTGILIGINLDGDLIFKNQQAQVVKDMEKKLVELKGNNEILESAVKNTTYKNEKLNSFIENNYDSIVGNELESKKIGMIYTTEDYFYSDMKDYISKASGNLAFQLVIKDKLFEQDSLSHINKALGVTLTNQKDTVNFILNSIFQKNRNVLDQLSKEGFLEFKSDYDFDQKLDGIVLAGGSQEKDEEKMKNIDLTAISYFKNSNTLIVGIEESHAKVSYMDFYKAQKISTVDNVDQIIGKISMIKVLEGKKGHFGEKETSESLFPKDVK